MPLAESRRGAGVSEVSAAAGDPAELPGLLTVLQTGELVLDGRLVESSNNALVGTVRADGAELRCVYKPIRGERPLWDFPGGRLAGREVAAFLVARAAGWTIPPATVFRDGPFGEGMVQQWITGAQADLVAEVFPADDVPAGWLPVLHAQGEDDEALIVAHADRPDLATIAVFDIIANNADRKASHLLATVSGDLYGVDHGLTFHAEPKLRTILWGWAGRNIADDDVSALDRLAAQLGEQAGGPLDEDLADYLTRGEIAALRRRVTDLVAHPVYPMPPDDRPAIPWPPL